MVLHIHHVQLAMPVGGEDRAREFYQELLGIPERPKPGALQKRGGCWFERGDLRVHLGVEQEFRPARKAHPGFITTEFSGLRDQMVFAGYAPVEGEKVDGHDRFFVDDPFGNRIEILDAGP